MLEKIGHIKNPLTVIAMFAAIAEVSGTLILPFIDAKYQGVYIWFLMSFPPFLVILFFGTLWWDHSVLYAPSDYQSDDAFTQILTGGSVTVKLSQLSGELQADNSVPESLAEANDPREEAQEAPAASAEQPDDYGRLPSEMLTPASRSSSALRSALVAEELVFERLTSIMGVNFRRNVSLRGDPSVVFDGVAFEPSPTLVEVKVTRGGVFATSNIERSFYNANKFWESLPAKFAKDFRFLFVVAHWPEVKPSALKRMQDALIDVSTRYRFKTDIVWFDSEDLKHGAPTSVVEIGERA